MRRKKGPDLRPVHIDSVIRLVRGSRVILDTDLARIYGIPTFRLNEAVKRNRDRFPEDFLFQMSMNENETLTSQIAMSKKRRGGRRTLPYAFTEHGAVMAANILNSERAIQMSIFVVRAFIPPANYWRGLGGMRSWRSRHARTRRTKMKTYTIQTHIFIIITLLSAGCVVSNISKEYALNSSTGKGILILSFTTGEEINRVLP